ncbi:MAG: cytochrome C oxidase subunit IV family protein [Acidobacteriota bacterium]|nr:cytochrome C oxidase subunit IV family protein [Acidobacteriota bacterium]
MEHSHADIDRHVKRYLIVGAALYVLTIVTVAAWRLHLSTGAAIALALAIALVKGSLVAAVFMHLISEKKLIYWTLVITVLFFFVLLLLPLFTNLDPVSL